MSDHLPLESRLRTIANRDDLFPPTPDIAGEMLDLLPDQSIPSSRAAGWRVAAIITLMVLVALATSLAVPASRTAIADFFGIEGIRIEFGQADDIDTPGTPESIGGTLLLGERAPFEEVMRAAPFEVMLPGASPVDVPDETWLNQRSGATVVGMLWRAGDALPEIGATGVGMLLLEIESDDDDVIFVKKVAGSGEFDTAIINDLPGYWIENGVLAVEPVEGLMLDLLDSGTRRSGNVLIWSDGTVTYRLETMLPKKDAVRIAESLAPVSSMTTP